MKVSALYRRVASLSMLLLIGAFTTLTAVFVTTRLRTLWDGDPRRLGWMSEQWLAEYPRSTPVVALDKPVRALS